MYHKDWITYDYQTLEINEYPNKNFYPTTFKYALRKQAEVIAEDVKPAVFVSGGIDSQAIAYAFKLSNLTADYTDLEERVFLLPYLVRAADSVASLSNVSFMKEFMTAIAFLEIPIFG